MEWQALLIIFLAFGIGSFAKGVTGIGLPLIAVPILANFIGVERTVVVMVLPGMISNFWLIYTHRRAAPPIRQLRYFLIAGFIGGLGGTWLLSVASERVLTLALAVWLAIYLGVLITKPGFRLPRWTAAPIGLAGGLIQGSTGVSAPVVGLYLSGIGLVKEAFVFAVALSFSLFSTAQMVAMTRLGLFSVERLIEGLYAMIPVILFMPLGIRWARAISPRKFELALLVIFVLMESRLVYQGIWGG